MLLVSGGTSIAAVFLSCTYFVPRTLLARLSCTSYIDFLSFYDKPSANFLILSKKKFKVFSLPSARLRMSQKQVTAVPPRCRHLCTGRFIYSTHQLELNEMDAKKSPSTISHFTAPDETDLSLRTYFINR